MDEHNLTIGCVVLAAGNGSRFGGNKLLAEYGGKPLIRRALEALPADLAANTVVVTQYEAVETMARSFGFRCLRNHAPELGVSHSVALGTGALAESCRGILYLVADQPLLTRETVLRLLEAFRARPDRIVVPAAEGRQGNPCIFPKDLFPALLSLTGDRGGKQIIRAHPDRVLTVEVPGEALYDVDTMEALRDLK